MLCLHTSCAIKKITVNTIFYMKLSNKKLKFIINRSEIGAGTRGSSLGPEALKVVAWKQQSTIFSEYDIEEVPTKNNFLNYPTEHQYAKRIDGFLQMYKIIVDSVQKSLQHNFFSIVLSGDHASASGTITGIKAAFPDKKIGVIWIDAHGDLHTPYTTPSGNIHGMPLALALNEDNLQCKRNNIPQSTKGLWEELKRYAVHEKKIDAQHIVFIGVRDTEDEENALIERLNIRNITVDEVHKKKIKQIVQEIEQYLSICDLIYVSFDVDVMEPDETGHGTGTPVKNGLSVSETQELLVELSRLPKLVALEIVEINPCLDERKNNMAEIAFDTLKKIIDNIY